MGLVDLPEALRAKIAVSETGCWMWTASTRRDGYGQVWVRFGPGPKGRALHYAHRATWEAVHGPVPDGLDLDHLCRVILCVNPDHLEPVTRRENLMRGDTIVRAHFEQRDCGLPACRSCPRFRVAAA